MCDVLCAGRWAVRCCAAVSSSGCAGLAGGCSLRRAAAGQSPSSSITLKLALLSIPLLHHRRSQFEVDFISLSYCNSEDDVLAARGVLDSLGMASTKIIAKVGGFGYWLGWVGEWASGAASFLDPSTLPQLYPPPLAHGVPPRALPECIRPLAFLLPFPLPACPCRWSESLPCATLRALPPQPMASSSPAATWASTLSQRWAELS